MLLADFTRKQTFTNLFS